MRQWARETGSAPSWVARLRFAEQFHVAPHTIGALPARWWVRWKIWERAQYERDVWRKATAYGLDKLTPDEYTVYNAMVLES